MDVLATFKEAFEISEGLRDLRLKKAMLELQSQILESQRRDANSQEEITRLNKLLDTRASMKASGPHNYLYKDNDDRPHCPCCWHRDEKTVLLPAPAKFAAGVG